MHKIRVILLLTAVTSIMACNTVKKPEIHFHSKFPEHNRNLTHALPDTFKVKYNISDTATFAVSYDKSTGINYIVDINDLNAAAAPAFAALDIGNGFAHGKRLYEFLSSLTT